MRVLVIGAGGHAEVVADALFCMQEQDPELEVVGFLDDNPELHGQHLLGRPILGNIGECDKHSHDAVTIAIGNNKTRRILFRKLQRQGERFAVVRHPQSTIARSAEVESGSVVCAGVVVNSGSRIGANVILNTSCSIDHHNRIGEHCHIGPGAHLGGDVIVGEGSLIGMGAVILPQTHIGANCIVAAGAVVREDVPNHSTVAGVPAKVLHRT